MSSVVIGGVSYHDDLNASATVNHCGDWVRRGAGRSGGGCSGGVGGWLRDLR